jgi:hypothetical protein
MTPQETGGQCVPTLRFHAPSIEPLRAGDRWHRLLQQMAQGVYRPAELLQLTDPRKHTRKVERLRILRALRHMQHVGLAEDVPGWGWTASGKGRDALAEIEERQG